jgi:hypothetical protein
MMAIPKKPSRSADDFIGQAVATKAEKPPQTAKSKTFKGRPKGPDKVQFPARVTVELLEAIRKNASGNISFFTEHVFRDYFARNNIKVDDN